MSVRHALSDKQWKALEPFLPPLNSGSGRKMDDRRRYIDGILWILKPFTQNNGNKYEKVPQWFDTPSPPCFYTSRCEDDSDLFRARSCPQAAAILSPLRNRTLT